MPGLVRAVIGDQEVNVGREYAESKGLEVLDEPVYREDGQIRPATRRGGRRAKPKVSVADKAAEKKAAAKNAEPADDNPPSH